MWIGFSTFLVNYMGFAIKNNSTISVGLSEASQRTMGIDDNSQLIDQNKSNKSNKSNLLIRSFYPSGKRNCLVRRLRKDLHFPFCQGIY